MTTQQSEYHILRTSLTIRRASLAVRFPCSLQFQLKTQSSTVDTRMAYELKEGRCEPNEKLSIDVEVLYRYSEYSEKKVTLMVMMVSSNGKIPAGSIVVKVTENGKIAEHSGSQAYSIEKCPDKSASIELGIKIEFLRSVTKSSPVEQYHAIRNKTTSYGNLPVLHQVQSNSERSHIPNNSRIKKAISPDNRKKLVTEGHDHDSPRRAIGIKNKKSIESNEYNNDDQSIIEEEFLFNHRTTFQRQKQGYIKQIERLKLQINSLRKEEQFKTSSSEEHLNRYRNEMDSMAREMAETSGKFRALERSHKELQTSSKDLKEQLEKSKQKVFNFETSVEQLKAKLDEKQRQVKLINDEVRLLRQQLEDKKLALNAQEKKVQYKEVTFKEQIKKLTEKYQQSEQERQKAVFDLNNTLIDYENNEKKMQLSSKEKERAFFEQKNKLTKKIQSLSQQNKEKQELILELQSLTEQQKFSLAVLNKSKQQLENDYKQLQVKFENLEMQNNKNNLSMTEMKAYIQDLEAKERAFNALSKKHIELNADLVRVNEQLSRANAKNEQLSKNLKELDTILKETNAGKDAANNRIAELNKEMQKIKKALEHKDNELQSSSETVATLSSKMSELKIKMQSEKIEFEGQLNRSQSEVLYLLKTQQGLHAELEDQKYKISRCEEYINTQNSKVASLNDNILKLNQELLSEQEQVKAHKNVIRELESSIDSLKTEILAKQNKEKELNLVIKGKIEQEYNHVKNVKQKEQQIFILKDHNKNYEVQLKQKSNMIETLTRGGEESTARLSKQLEAKRVELSQALRRVEDSIKNNEKLQQQIQYHKSVNEDNKKQLAQAESQLEGRNAKFMELQSRYEQVTKNEAELTMKLQLKEESVMGYKKEWEKYREETRSAVEQFITEISKDISPSSAPSSARSLHQTELISFPDESLSMLQIQAIKKRYEVLTKYREQLKQQGEQIAILNAELARVKEYSKNRERQLEQEKSSEKQRFRVNMSESLQERNTLLEKLNAVEQKLHEQISENEKGVQEQARLKQQSELLEESLFEEREKAERLSERIKLLEKEVLSLNHSQSQYKNTNQSEIESLIEENKSQLDKYKTVIKDLEKKVNSLASQSQHHEEEARRLGIKLSEAEHANQKLTKKLQYSESKHQELQEIRKSTENQLYNLERKSQQEKMEKDKIIEALNLQKYKVEDLSMKVKKMQESINILQVEKKQLEKQLEAAINGTIEQDVATKKLEHNSRNTIEKSQETIKELRAQIITLNSDLELKSFLNAQLEANNSELKTQLAAFANDTLEKKQLIIRLKEELENTKNELIFLQQNYESVNSDKEGLEVEVRKNREALEALTNQVMEQNVVAEILASKEREYDRLKEEYESLENKHENSVRDYKQMVSDLKREIANKTSREEEYKRRIRQMEKEIAHKVYQLNSEASRGKDEQDRERLELLRNIDMLENENNRLRNQCEYLQQQAARELEEVNRQCAELTRLVAEKEEQLILKTEQHKQSEKKVKTLTNDLRNAVDSWERERKEIRIRTDSLTGSETGSSKFQKVINEIDSRSKNLPGKMK